MLTTAELNYNTLVKEVFQTTLKPLGYKKKGNNFYLHTGSIGKLISLQKSALYSKGYIKFTINIGLFSARLWDAYYTYSDKKSPVYPTIGECSIRRRIGKLLNSNDLWYEVSDGTDLDHLQSLQHASLTKVILPYLNCINTDEDILLEAYKCLPSEVYIT